MTRTFKAELNQFIHDELQTGGSADEDAVLTAALEVFREVRQRHAELRGRVQESLGQIQTLLIRPTWPLSVNSTPH